MNNIISTYFSEFSETQVRQFSMLQPLYEEWNQKINVISRKDMDNFYLHHVLHSLTIAAEFEFKPNTHVLDLGTGGGFPGIPLAIFFPETKFHLVDSINKKLNVVRAVVEATGLENVTVEHSRVEELKRSGYDVVVSRAVAPLNDLWRWSRPLLKRTGDHPNGLICLKGGDLSQEIFESGCKPMVWAVEQFFPESYFKDKYLLYQPLKK
jgi:16S rRNA (guanine527-N7)-methyltransferase